MATAESVKNKIINLTNKANEITGNNDADLTSAVNSLVDGYGGGTANLQEKSVTPSDSEQNITADDGYTGLSGVTVGKIAKPFIDSSKMKYFSYMFNNGNADLGILDNLDTSNGIYFDSMFYQSEVKQIPKLDLSNGLSFRFMFFRSSIEILPELFIENAKDLYAIFSSCAKLSGKITINAPKNENISLGFDSTSSLSEIDFGYTGCVKNWSGAFQRSGVETISCLDFSSATNISNVFNKAYNLKNITFVSIPIFDNNFSIKDSPLSEESLASLVNALSDNSGLDTTYTVTLGATNIAKLTEEQLAIVAAKNINLA